MGTDLVNDVTVTKDLVAVVDDQFSDDLPSPLYSQLSTACGCNSGRVGQVMHKKEIA